MDFPRFFRTLADETRFRLLRLLWREELSVNELAQITQLAQPRISNHLKILKEEGLIVERREGAWRNYRVDADQLAEPAHSLWPQLEAAWKRDSAFDADDKRLAAVLDARVRHPEGAFFDELAGRWDDIRDNLFGDALGREILRAFLPPDIIVADVGTGTGYMLQLFGKHCRKLIAIDNSEAMLSLARAKAKAAALDNVEFRLADATASPLSSGETNVITIVQVLHHFEKPGDAIGSLAKGLRPGGLMILSDFLPHQEKWLRTRLRHRWSGFSRTQVAEWFAAAGLKLKSWDVLAGRVYQSPDGERLTIPDAFTAAGHKAK